MEITNDKIAKKLLRYLQHKITLNELVDWAETEMMHADFQEGNEKKIRNILGKIGLADVKEFGLNWEDCELIMHDLGYKIRVDATAA